MPAIADPTTQAGRRHRPGYDGRRRAGPGGMRRAGRLRELLVSGVVDSFGMSLGWTVIVLLAVARGGLAEAALYNAAMLAGAVLSAPVTGWLSRRFTGRALLQGAAGTELVMRVGVLAGLLIGLPTVLVAVGIAVMHVAAWVGFAGMRAEVTAVDRRPQAMTRYALSIAAIEAAGTGLGALLPAGAGGHPTGPLLVMVFLVYGGSLLPTLFAARRARVAPDNRVSRDVPTVRTAQARAGAHGPGGRSSQRGSRRARPTRPAAFARLAARGWPASPKLLAAGGTMMLFAAGPTLLAVPLTTELHGRTWVAGAAVTFSLGCLLSSVAVEVVGKMQLPAVLRWSLWGLGMLIGWIAAPLHASSVLVAQFLAGVSLTAFEGDMDARVAKEAPPEGVTTALAYSASTRALGSAVAVRLLPALAAAPAIGAVAGSLVLVLGWATLVAWVVTLVPRETLRRAFTLRPQATPS